MTLNSPCFAIVYCVTGPGVPVPGLSYTARIDDPTPFIQFDDIILGKFYETRSTLVLLADEWDVRMTNQAVPGLQQCQGSQG
jgi:hypothetical protein